MNNPPLFSVLTVTYCRFDLLQQSLKAMMDQTYKNLEIIVVNHGATSEIKDYLNNVKASDNRIKIVHFSENLFSNNDPLVTVRVCYNAALKAATGDYVFIQSDDDLMSIDYIEKMAALFENDPNCTSAAGVIKCIDETGRLIDEGIRTNNYRPRYMPGHLMALNGLCKGEFGSNEVMFGAPGPIFSFKREDIIKAGGYHMAIEQSQLFGIVPFGVTGFDETAVFYWRRHKAQTVISHGPNIGFIGTIENVALIKDWQIEERWQVFGKDVAQYVTGRILENIYVYASYWFVVSLYFFRFKAGMRILKDACKSVYFWRAIPALLWTERRQFWYFLKSKLRGIFQAHPRLARVPFLISFKNKVFN